MEGDSAPQEISKIDSCATEAREARRTEMPRRDKRRKLDGDSASSSINSCAAESPSLYLVVGHESSKPAYSVFKVDPFADDGGTRMRIWHRMKLASLYAKHSMSFIPVRSRHGPWIVGVGGDTAHQGDGPETIAFDTKTGSVITGPKLVATKSYPVLLSIGDRIYALSRSPSVKDEPDFVPWFEVLDLSKAQVRDGHLVSCEWRPLPRPPFFPWDLTPRQYIVPPEVIVESYVAVGSCILLSLYGQTGTHMFDTQTELWVELGGDGLPFTGAAIPHGPLFLGLSSANGEITAYKIMVCNNSASASPTVKKMGMFLSIVEFPVVTDMEDQEEERVISNSRIVSLGDLGFCSLSCGVNYRPTLAPHTRELVSVRTYTSQDHFNSIGNLLVSNQRKQVYSIHDYLRGLTWPCLEAVISF